MLQFALKSSVISESVKLLAASLKSELGIIQGHWKWHHLIVSYTSFYWHSTFTMSLSRIVSEIKRDTWSKIAQFFVDTTVKGDSVGISPRYFVY